MGGRRGRSRGWGRREDGIDRHFQHWKNSFATEMIGTCSMISII